MRHYVLLICAGLVYSTIAAEPTTIHPDAGGLAGCQLANDKLNVRISGAGKLLSVENRLASETYAFESDAFELDTDLGLFSNKVTGPVRVRKEGSRVVFHFEFDRRATGKVGVDLIYTLGDTSGFFRRALNPDYSPTARFLSWRSPVL